MARGTMFVITEDLNDFPGTTADSFQMSCESGQAEWYEDVEDIYSINCLIESLKGTQKKAAAADGTEFIEAVFPEGCREDYFRSRFNEFKKITENMSLDTFASVRMNELKGCIEDSYGDAVIDKYEVFHTLDAWIRTIVPGMPYYFRKKCILMH